MKPKSIFDGVNTPKTPAKKKPAVKKTPAVTLETIMATGEKQMNVIIKQLETEKTRLLQECNKIEIKVADIENLMEQLEDVSF